MKRIWFNRTDKQSEGRFMDVLYNERSIANYITLSAILCRTHVNVSILKHAIDQLISSEWCSELQQNEVHSGLNQIIIWPSSVPHSDNNNNSDELETDKQLGIIHKRIGT